MQTSAPQLVGKCLMRLTHIHTGENKEKGKKKKREQQQEQGSKGNKTHRDIKRTEGLRGVTVFRKAVIRV